MAQVTSTNTVTIELSGDEAARLYALLRVARSVESEVESTYLAEQLADVLTREQCNAYRVDFSWHRMVVVRPVGR